MASNLRVWLLIHLLLFVVFFCPFAYGKVIYVDDDAVGTNDGSSWQNAYTFLQDALIDANDSEKLVEIRVAQGTYKPNQGIFPIIPAGVGGRTNEPYPAKYPADLGNKASFILINNVTIKGGYAGLWDSEPNVRDIELYEAILSGDLNGDDIDVNDPCDLRNEPTRIDNSNRIVNVSGTDDTTVLDGFTIIGGFGPFGAGMSIENGSATLIDCTFQGNTAYHDYGGGLLNSSGNPMLINCTFTKNSGELGGGMCSIRSSPTLTGCVFTGNYANYGAGLCNMKDIPKGNSTRDSNSTLIDCMFIDNIARFRGGGIYNGESDSHLSNCTFSGNSSLVYGAGMFNRGGNIVMRDCSFIENMGGSGGGVYSEDNSNLMLSNCVIWKNIATVSGGGMCNADANSIFLRNCLLSNNTAEQAGGGLAGSGNKATLVSCVFSGNKVYGELTGTSKGGGFHAFGDAMLINCTFYGNWAQNYCAVSKYTFSDIRLVNCILWDGGNEIIQTGTRPNIIYSNIQGGWEGEGNIDEDPLFVNPGYWSDADDPNIIADPSDPNAVWIDGDYHLKSQAGRWDPVSESWVIDDVTSPCIDAGDPNSPVAFEPSPNGGIINMGAYGGTPEASMSPSGLHAKYGGGTGEPNNPYLIYTAEHLNAIGTEPNDWYKHFKLMADIDLAGYSYDQALIAPDVDTDEYYFQGIPYAGVFDGNGHTISHLTITGVSYLGLFGELASGAEVKDLGVVDVNISGTGDVVGGLTGHTQLGAVMIRCYSTGMIKGDDDIGGLVGSNGGHVRQCYSNGAVSGNYIVGGLLGANEGQAAVTNCYSTGVVSGDDAVGGLVGFNLGDVTHCYSAGAVTGDQRVGGLVGWIYGSIVSSFWDIQSSGQVNMCGTREEGASGCDDSYGLTTVEMQTAVTFLNAGWDFVDETENGIEDIWWIIEGQDYPRLSWELIE